MVEDDFDARFRGPALAVLAARSIMPENSLTRQAAQYLLGGLGQQGIWTSTSDTGWALLALGEYYKGASFPEEAGKITVSQPRPPRPGAQLGARQFTQPGPGYARPPQEPRGAP